MYCYVGGYKHYGLEHLPKYIAIDLTIAALVRLVLKKKEW